MSEAPLEPPGQPLPRDFYSRPVVTVARELLGKLLISHRGGQCAGGRIVEVEAYLGQGDCAAHSAAGVTPRTAVLFGQPGHAYVYLIYGLHHCLNVVCEPARQAGCVLIRAVEPLFGAAEMRSRRSKASSDRDLASGPAKLTQSLAITLRDNGSDLVRGPLRIHGGSAPAPLVDVSERIGIRHDAHLPLRFTIRGSRYLSR